jgi:hypothetical protein
MAAMLFQRNGHLPVGPGPADPGWGQTQGWQLDGDSPTISTYDQPFAPSDTDFHSEIRAGLKRLWDRLAVSEPTMTRQARVSAQQVSLPAARFFQSYAHSGTGRATSPVSAGGVATVPHQTSTASRRGTAWGAAELHPATTYDPFPSPSSLYPKVV